MLCYYSTYFDRCFNGGFKEAQEQKLVLPEGRVEYFQHLLDYMFVNGREPFKAKSDSKEQMEYYIDFIEYAGKHKNGEGYSEVVYYCDELEHIFRMK
jgi:hypothetical protein